MADERELLEEAVVISEALAERRAKDPLFLWEPTAKQHPFIDSVMRQQKPENWFIAANRSGKSDAGAYIGACLARFGCDPKGISRGPSGIEVVDRATSGWVVSQDFPSSRDIMQPKYFDNGMAPKDMRHPPFIPEREIVKDGWRVSDQILKLKRGSIIGYKSADSGARKFSGVEKDWVHFDEEPPQPVYDETVIRIGAGKKLIVFGTVTLLPPEGQIGGVSWIEQEIINKVQSGEKAHIGLFGASIYDNPHLDPQEIARAEATYPPGTPQHAIRILGEWGVGIRGARAYPTFDRRIHVKGQPWPPLPRRPLAWAWDFNVEPMVSIIGQRDGTLFRVMRELVLEEGNILEMVQMFYDILPRHQGEIWIYGDATGKGRTSQTGQSDYQIILNAMRQYGAPVRLKVPEQNPAVPDRVNAVILALKNERGEINTEVDPSCRELISDLEQVQRDGRGGIKKTRDRKDVYYRRSHTSDAFGYWVSYEAPVRPKGLMAPRPASIRTPGYAWTSPPT